MDPVQHQPEDSSEGGRDGREDRSDPLRRIPTHDQSEFLGIDDRSLTPAYGAPRDRARPQGVSVVLETTRDAELMHTAVTHRIGDLGSLAKKNSGEGYSSAARVQLGDADVLERRILPQLTGQLALFREPSFADALGKLRSRWQQELERRLANAANLGERHGAESNMVKETRLENAEEFATQIAAALEAFSLELYDRAYHAGLSERRGSYNRTAVESAGHFGI